VAGPLSRGPSQRRRRLGARAAVSVGLLALVLPIATAGAAAAATLAGTPSASASVNGRVRQLAYIGDTLYLVGDFTQATDNGTTVTRNHAAAIDSTTGHLLPWNPNANGSIYGIAVDAANGVVYLGGKFTAIGGLAETKLAQVSADTGAANPAWKVKVGGVVNALSIGDGKLYVGGRITKVGTTPRTNAAAVDLGTGALDPTFAPAMPDGQLYSIKAAPGRIYLGGDSTSIDGSTRLSKLAAVDPTTGALDPTFVPTIAIPWDVFDIDVAATTVYVAVGGPGGWLWSLAPSGATNWVVTVDGNIQTVTDVGGLIVGGGHFDNVCSNYYLGPHGDCTGVSWPRKKLFAVDSNGALQDWAPTANSALGVYTARANAAGSQLSVGGDFTSFMHKTIQQPHVALFGIS
jgi:beta-propeller uncharacterized protein DUF5122